MAHEAQAIASEQQRLAKSYEARGQCRACGAFTLTGDPPKAHRTDCVYENDEMRVYPRKRRS